MRCLASHSYFSVPPWRRAHRAWSERSGWIFTVGGALIVLGLLLLAVIYGAQLDYRFEVMSLSVAWLVLISSGVLLSVVFNRRL